MVAVLPPRHSNPLPAFSQLCRGAKMRGMIKFLLALWSKGRCFPCWSSVFTSHQRRHAQGHPHSPKPSGTGPCWLCCAFRCLVKGQAATSPSLLCPLQPTLWIFPMWEQIGQSSNLTHPVGLRCSPGQTQSLNRYDLYDADRPVYCPWRGLCETRLMKCKAVGGFRCSCLLGHKDQKVPTFGRR